MIFGALLGVVGRGARSACGRKWSRQDHFAISIYYICILYKTTLLLLYYICDARCACGRKWRRQDHFAISMYCICYCIILVY